MPNVTITIPEADVADVRAAAEAFTGLPPSANAKELVSATMKIVTVRHKREIDQPPAPGVE